MATLKRRLPFPVSSTDWRKILNNIRYSSAEGTFGNLFEDQTFIFDLIKILNEDAVDVTVKIEFLGFLEQHGSNDFDKNRLNQALSFLLDCLGELGGQNDNPRLLVQLLLTITTLIIQHDYLKSRICESFTLMLMEIVSRVNDISTRRFRGCACQCLRQLELWNPNCLSCYKDKIVLFVREERTDVCQDYAALLSVILTSLVQQSVHGKSPRLPADEVVPPLSFLMDNAFLFTPSGLWPIVQSVMYLVKNTLHVSPTIFKPLMLQHMATFDPCLFHIILYIQKEFKGKILSKEEEQTLLLQLVSGINLLALRPALRLLQLQWLKGFVDMKVGHQGVWDDQTAVIFQRHLQASIFDSVDIHVDKLTVVLPSFPVGQDDKILNAIHYLKRLALTTGNEQAAVGLYRALFTGFAHHRTQRLSDIVVKITQDLVVDYPHLIPLILDFLQAVEEKIGDGSVYSSTLSSLHSQVLNGGQAEVLSQYRFFLQVFNVSAKQPEINQNKTVRYLLNLVRYAQTHSVCDWGFGNAVLSICRNLLLHHCTDFLYQDIGELLLEILTSYKDTEIRNRARFLYALLTGACDEKFCFVYITKLHLQLAIQDVLGTKLLGGAVLSQNIASILTGSTNQKEKAEVMSLKETVFCWERLLLNPSFRMLASASSILTADKEDILENYYSNLTHLHTDLIYQCKLSLKEPAEYAYINAVTVKVKADSNSISNVQDIHLLSLSRFESKELSIKLTPKEPKPSILSCSVLFSVEDITITTCPLPPLEVNFTDLILVLPWQLLGLSDSQTRLVVFEKLWKTFTSEDPENRQGVESIKVLKCEGDKLKEIWAPFSLSGNSSEKDTSDRFLLFLPPCFHLLLRVFPQGPKQVVNMATDYWKILPCFNNYLNSIND